MTFDFRQLPKGPFTDLFAYWRSLSIDGLIPSIASFDILAIPALVPSITVFDFQEGRFLIHFSGAGIVRETGVDSTGLFLDDFTLTKDVMDRCTNCIRTGQPYYALDLPVTWSSKDFKTFNALGLPLADVDHTTTRIVYLMDFC